MIGGLNERMKGRRTDIWAILDFLYCWIATVLFPEVVFPSFDF